MKDKKRYYFKDIIIVILLIIGAVFGYLALLNGRYEVINRENAIFLWDLPLLARNYTIKTKVLEHRRYV